MPDRTTLLIRIAFLLLWGLSFSLGMAGIDFGNHWDEPKLVRSVIKSYQTGVLLPGWYNYPSLSYGVMMLASLPEVVSVAVENTGALGQFVGESHDVGTVLGVSEQIQARLEPRLFLPNARPFFLFISLLAGWWVYLTTRQLTRNSLASLFAAGVFFSSWEFAYHARWAAPDTLLAQFAILTCLLVIASLRAQNAHKKLFWLSLAAIAAGLTCGAKYFGGLFLFPVLVAGFDYAHQNRFSWGGKLVMTSALVVVFGVTFVLTTPAMLVDPLRVIKDIQFEITHYSNGHLGYSVKPGLEHLMLLLPYLASVAFSPVAPLAAIIFGLSITGIYAVIRQSRWLESVTLVGMPVLHLLYISTQSVLFVRNYQVLLPFLAVLAALGIFFLWQHWIKNLPRQACLGLATGLVAILAVNFFWQALAVQSIQQRDKLNSEVQLLGYIQSNPQTAFLLSPLSAKLLENHPEVPGNIVTDPAQADMYVILSSIELEYPQANRFGVYSTPLGPYEVNFNYYPSWDGEVRLVFIPIEEAIAQGLLKE